MQNNFLTRSDVDIVNKLAKMQDSEFTAYHEAGHVICALLYFMRVNKVYIFENKYSNCIDGETEYNYINPHIFRQRNVILKLLKSQICVSYAGLICEKIYFEKISGSDKLPLFLIKGSCLDRVSISKLIINNNIVPAGKERLLYKNKLINLTTKNLHKSWEDVSLIAQKLFQKKKLIFKDLEKILTKNSKNKYFWKEQFRLIKFIHDNYCIIDEKYLRTII